MSEMSGKDLGIINVDGGAKATIEFLQAMGLRLYLRQLEMKMDLKE
jgi:hypothetical protein